MDPTPLFERLESNATVLRRMLESVGPERAAWRPDPDKWSVLEVAAHLLDEESEDFPARLRLLIESPGTTWPPIDPVGWVESREYASRDLATTVGELVEERGRSIAWLRSRRGVDWRRAYRHPQLGDLEAGDLLAAWAAHDALHIRQLAGLEFAWIERLAAPHTPAYAGEW